MSYQVTTTAWSRLPPARAGSDPKAHQLLQALCRSHLKGLTRITLVAMVLLLVGAGAAPAQEETGNLYAKVKAAEGDALPGVICELEGVGTAQRRVTTAQGEARWLALDPGRRDLTCALEGFATVEFPGLDVRVARNTSIELIMRPALDETLTVTAESPLLDLRKLAAGTWVTQIELETIPTARDPWAVLNQTPGVVVEKINVGGDESGQQSVFRAPGVEDAENSWLFDGVEITDSVVGGSSLTYFDFDQFTEMQFSTGGSDVTKATSGVSVNLVTKRGTNEFRGSARFFRSDDDFFDGLLQQDTPIIVQPDDRLAAGQESFVGNTVDQVTDYGFEAGGPVLHDRLWFWGSFGVNDIKNRTGGETLVQVQSEHTILENTAFKLNTQLWASNSLLASWNSGLKEQLGRGAGPTRPPLTTWDAQGVAETIKVEDTHVLGSNLFLGGSWAKQSLPFELLCKACKAAGSVATTPEAWQDANRVWHNSFVSGTESRRSEQWNLDGSYFFDIGPTSHELKIGARYRDFTSSGRFDWPGRDIFSLALAGGRFPLVVAKRGLTPPVGQEYTSAWLQDTLTRGKLTANVGLRLDRQDGTNEPTRIGANPLVPEVLPAVEYRGDEPFEWTSVTPRIGLTYALGGERQTLLRASFAQFADQLSRGDISLSNPVDFAYANFLNLSDQAAGPDPNHRYHDGDVLLLIDWSGFDPADPTALESPNITDPDLDPPITSELILGLEHSFLPEFVAALTLTLRNRTDLLETRDLVRDSSGAIRVATLDDYVPDRVLEGTLPDGSSYQVPLFALDSALEFTGGALRTNGDREVDYLGLTGSFTKRLANRWMARGFFHFGQAEWDIPASYRRTSDPNRNPFGVDVDGGLFVGVNEVGILSTPPLQSSWSANLNGMYQVAPDRPWGFNIAANLYAREGFALPYWERVTASDGRTRAIRAVDQVDDIRLDDVFTTDLRLEKEFAASENVGFTFSIDIFNLFNEAYELQRETDLSSGSANYLRKTLSPRVWRLGVRLSRR